MFTIEVVAVVNEVIRAIDFQHCIQAGKIKVYLIIIYNWIHSRDECIFLLRRIFKLL